MENTLSLFGQSSRVSKPRPKARLNRPKNASKSKAQGLEISWEFFTTLSKGKHLYQRKSIIAGSM